MLSISANKDCVKRPVSRSRTSSPIWRVGRKRRNALLAAQQLSRQQEVPHDARFQGLNQTAQEAPTGELPDGIYLVRVASSSTLHARKPFYLLRLSVLEPHASAASRPGDCIARKKLCGTGLVSARLCYDTERLNRDEVRRGDRRPCGIVKIRYTVVHGTSLVNLDGFGPPVSAGAGTWHLQCALVMPVSEASRDYSYTQISQYWLAAALQAPYLEAGRRKTAGQPCCSDEPSSRLWAPTSPRRRERRAVPGVGGSPGSVSNTRTGYLGPMLQQAFNCLIVSRRRIASASGSPSEICRSSSRDPSRLLLAILRRLCRCHRTMDGTPCLLEWKTTSSRYSMSHRTAGLGSPVDCYPG